MSGTCPCCGGMEPFGGHCPPPEAYPGYIQAPSFGLPPVEMYPQDLILGPAPIVPVVPVVPDDRSAEVERLRSIIREAASVIEPECPDLDSYPDGHCSLPEAVDRMAQKVACLTKPTPDAQVGPDIELLKSIQHLAACAEAWMPTHIPGQETIGMQDDIDRVKAFLARHLPTPQPPAPGDHP